MRELSLHILDIIQNSITASARDIELIIIEDPERNLFQIQVFDNGRGIRGDRLSQVTDPFVTSRDTRRVGLGLSLFQEAARRCGGDLELESAPGQGTRVTAYFQYNHIDRAPLGDIQGTLISLIALNPEINFRYHHIYVDNEFILDTEEIKKELGVIEINRIEVLNWIREFLDEELKNLYGGGSK
ncbi:MAG: sensor histidine kinase [Halanaerobiaceae bacterium]|jgi:anti-sigma regulatory factor (Ser/Thr protein kinase)|nr:sensor histidine kinase [Halanaerobiaceae bacterium]